MTPRSITERNHPIERPLMLLSTLVGAAVAAVVAPVGVVGISGDVAVGSFNRNLIGASAFVEAGTNAQVYGVYRGLRANRSYFTVAYANTVCDPAQAFPVGPFVTDGRGRGRLAKIVPLNGIDLGTTRSISVRRGDNGNDLDGDGLLGPSDVVAVPGNPGVGLIECDSSPYLLRSGK